MRLPEILAPCGNLKVLKAAVSAGADAVYFGGQAFNARKSADNFSLEELKEAVRICRLHKVKTNFTLNTLIKESEWPQLLSYLEEILPLGFDALILQDLGVVRAVAAYYEAHPEVPRAALHASTQMAVEDLNGVLYLKELGFSRVVLARELTLPEIKKIAKQAGIEVEVFVHGALCYCDSGRCLLSAFHGGRSGNRGACAQPCRLLYTASCPEEGKGEVTGYFMNLKDREIIANLKELCAAGVASLKIEGRLKGEAYTAGVTAFYRKLLEDIQHGKEPKPSKEDADTVMQLFNRGGFTEGYLTSKNKMIEPSSPKNQGLRVGKVVKVQNRLITVISDYDLHPGDELEIVSRSGLRTPVRVAASMLQGPNKKRLSFRLDAPVETSDVVFRVVDPVLTEAIKKQAEVIAPLPVSLKLTATLNEPMTLVASHGKIFAKAEGAAPTAARTRALTQEDLIKQLKKTGGTDFTAESIQIDMDDDLFVPLSEVNDLRRRALDLLAEKITTPPTQKPKTYGILRPSVINSPDTTEVPAAEVSADSITRVGLHDAEKLSNTGSGNAKGLQGCGFNGAVQIVVQHSGQLEEALARHNADEKVSSYETSPLILMPVMENFAPEEIGTFMEEVREGAENVLVVPRLPKVGRMIHEDWMREQMDLWMKEGAFGFEACRLGQIKLIHESGACVFAGPDFGVMNKEAAMFFEEQRIPYVVSVEISPKEVLDIEDMPLGFVTTSYRPCYMVTEQCIYKEAFGCHKRPQGHRSIVTDRKGEEMLLLSHCELCYSELFAEKPVELSGPFKNIRVELPL